MRKNINFKEVSIKFISINIITIAFLTVFNNPLNSYTKSENSIKVSLEKEIIPEKIIILQQNNKFLKPYEYLEQAENYEEEILSAIRFRTIKPYYNASLLKLSSFGTSLERKDFNFKDSIKKIENWIKLSNSLKNPIKYFYVKSLYYVLTDNYPEAIKFAEKTIQANQPKYYENLAKLYAHEFYSTKAIEMYSNSIKIAPQFKAQNLRRIGDIYWDNRFYDKALNFYSESINSDETISLPFRAYYYKGLCGTMVDLSRKNLNISFLKGIEIITAQYCENRPINNAYFKDSKYARYSSEQIEKAVDIGSNYADRAKFNLEKNNLEVAEENYKQASYLGGYYWGDLVLVQIKLGKIPEAYKTIDIYLVKQKQLNDLNIFDISKTNYDYKIYLGLLQLDEKNKYLNAQRLILSSPDKQIALQEIDKYFETSSEEYKNLIGLSEKYEKFYQYFSNKGMDMIINTKNIEKTRILLTKISANDRKKVNTKEIEKSLSSFR